MVSFCEGIFLSLLQKLGGKKRDQNLRKLCGKYDILTLQENNGHVEAIKQSGASK